VANVDSGPDSQAVPPGPPRFSRRTPPEHGARYVDSGYLAVRSPATPTGSRPGQADRPSGVAPTRPRPTSTRGTSSTVPASRDLLRRSTNQCGPTSILGLVCRRVPGPQRVREASTPRSAHRLNPGTAVPQSTKTRRRAGDLRGTYGDYTGTPDSPGDAYQPLNLGTGRPPQDLAHRLTRTATQAEMEQVMALSKSRNAGYVYVTDDVAPIPMTRFPLLPIGPTSRTRATRSGTPGPTPHRCRLD